MVDPLSPRGRLKDLGLPFEGFLEALCHLSLLKALPTDEQMQQHARDQQAAAAEEAANELGPGSAEGDEPAGAGLLRRMNQDEPAASQPRAAINAGRFLLELRQFDRPAYRKLLLSGCTEWGEGPYSDAGFAPGLHRRVEHLMHLIFHTIEVCVERSAEALEAVPGSMELKEREWAFWKKRKWPKDWDLANTMPAKGK